MVRFGGEAAKTNQKNLWGGEAAPYPTAERYDRGLKFQHYRTIDSLQEYILVAQNEPHIERFMRHGGNEWVFSETAGMDAVMPIISIQASLALSDVYDQVEFVPAATSQVMRERSQGDEP